MNIRFSKSQDLQLQPILTIKRVKKKILFKSYPKKILLFKRVQKLDCGCQ